jgi:hypothetical protein
MAHRPLEEIGLRRLLEMVRDGDSVAASVRLALASRGLVEPSEAGGLTSSGQHMLDDLKRLHAVADPKALRSMKFQDCGDR